MARQRTVAAIDGIAGNRARGKPVPEVARFVPQRGSEPGCPNDSKPIVARRQIRQEAGSLSAYQNLGVPMKAILCSQYGGPDDLVLAEVADPVAGPG